MTSFNDSSMMKSSTLLTFVPPCGLLDLHGAQQIPVKAREATARRSAAGRKTRAADAKSRLPILTHVEYAMLSVINFIIEAERDPTTKTISAELRAQYGVKRSPRTLYILLRRLMPRKYVKSVELNISGRSGRQPLAYTLGAKGFDAMAASRRFYAPPQIRATLTLDPSSEKTVATPTPAPTPTPTPTPTPDPPPAAPEPHKEPSPATAVEEVRAGADTSA